MTNFKFLGNSDSGVPMWRVRCHDCGRRADVPEDEIQGNSYRCIRCRPAEVAKIVPLPEKTRLVREDGYTLVKTGDGWRSECRLVAGEFLGRALESDERIHHINGDRADNRPENLAILKPIDLATIKVLEHLNRAA